MTTNPPAVSDLEGLTVTRAVTIDAPVEKVWAAITEPEHISRWFGQRAVLDELALGARGVFSFDGYGDFPVLIEELEPLRVIAYRWSNDNARALNGTDVDLEHSTVFRFTLERAGAGTVLTVVERGFGTLTDPQAALESNRGGWTAELDELVAYVESIA
ncbi:SRPBCC family protein [Cellulomonas sp. 73-145]|uniref:SRPBCC family protein n=1 Tax=Cellulomonas sp. 73-145 TaxID=1895739 RepID=UPI0025BC6E8B|nr:SRPBCC family protein [Cellulomonas sp. 73-145]